MNIAIRADASSQIGSGHIMRCLTLAQALRKRDIFVTFVCRAHSGNMIEKIQSEGFDTSILPLNEKSSNSTQWQWIGDNQKNDARDTLLALQEKGLDYSWIIVDHYFLDSTWEAFIRSRIKQIMVVDDLANRPHDCDILLDQNYYPQSAQRYEKLVSNTCTQLIGPQYALLREQFSQARKQTHQYNKDVKQILVFFGGADITNETEKTLRALQQLDTGEISIHVIIGGANPNWPYFQEEYGKRANIIFHRNVEDMATLMSQADLAVGAGGSTTWERCCVGLPTIAWPIAENQQELLQNISVYGAVYKPDSLACQSSDTLARIIYCIIHSPDLRAQIRQSGYNLVDGHGANRVVDHIIPLSISISLREALQSDTETIYQWRNDSTIRAVSVNTDEIPFSSHKKWIESVLADPQRLLFIAEANHQPVGVLRYDIDGNTAEVSIFLSPDSQGKGYGKQILRSGETLLHKTQPQLEYIHATILEKNIRSRKLFLESGFEESSRLFIKSLQA